MSPTITETEYEQFREDGYLFFPGLLDTDRVADLKREADRILEEVVNASLATGRTSGRLVVAERPDGRQVVRKIDPVLDLSARLDRLMTGPTAALVGQLLDDDAVSLERTAQLNYKEPLPEPVPELDASMADDSFPVHSDWAYYERGEWPEGVVTSAVFLDDVGTDSGPIQVWPGTHTEELEHERTDGGLQVREELLDFDAGQRVTGEAGSVLLFDARLVHSSDPNTSGRPRRLLIGGHAAADAVTTPVEGGTTRAGEHYPRELVESRHESEYRRLKRDGDYHDKFAAPAF